MPLQECPEFCGSNAARSLTNHVRAFVESLKEQNFKSSASLPHRPSTSQTPSATHRALTSPQPSVTPGGGIPTMTPASSGQASIRNSTHPVHHSTGESSLQQREAQGTSERQHAFNATQSTRATEHSSLTPTPNTPQHNTSAAGLRSSTGDLGVSGTSQHASISSHGGWQSVGRAAVESLGGLQWQLLGSDKDVERELYTAVFQLKALMRDSRCVAMVSLPAGQSCTGLLRNCGVQPVCSSFL